MAGEAFMTPSITPQKSRRAATPAAELKRLRISLSGKDAKELANSNMEIADSAMGWGNASFCHTVLAGRLALLHFPDGCRLIASLLYPVRSSIVTSEAARAAANLAFYASSNGLHLIVPISTGGCMSSMVLGMQTAALTSRGMSPTAGTSTDDTLLCSGVLPEIVKAIQWSAAEADDDVAQCCCMALSDICLDSPSRRIAAVESDAVVAVMAVLEKFNSEPDIRIEAERALAMLACEAVGRRAIAKASHPRQLLRVSKQLDKGEVMLKRSKTILDVREQEAECARRGGNPSAMWCPRSSPTKRTPLQRGAPQRGQDDRSSTPTAENELRRLRWHRGEWMPDRKGRPKPVVDCTQQMPCKGAVRRSQVSISDRVVLSNGGNGMEHFASAGFYEVRTGPTQGDSFLLCLVFSLLEQLLGLPMNNHEPAGVDVPRGEDVCEPGLPVLTRTQAVDNCRSRVRRMGRDTANLDTPLKELVACGCQNLLAILDALCDTDRPFTSNELADVLAGSMRFSCALIAFLRAVASRAMQEKPEAASRIIGHSSTLGAQDLRGLCSRHVEPLGAPPAQVANAMFNALAEEFDVCIKFHGYPSLANMASFPQGQSSCDRATLFIGHFSRAGQACFAILYPKLQRDRCPHFADIRRWASSRVGTIVKCNAPFKPWRIMKAYPPLPVDDSQLVAAAWQPARRDMTSPAFTRLRPGPQPASSTSKLKSQNESVRRKLDATLSKDNGTVRK